jgi:hypothetical protein
MKKFGILVLIVFSIGILFAGTYDGGSGTSDAPYLISTLFHLQELADTPADWNLYFQQTADIDASLTSTSNPTTSSVTYNASTTYSSGTIVKYNSTNYISLIDNNLGKQPDTNPSYWALCNYKGWKPIGYDPTNTGGANRFKGNYDGNEKTISNLYINRPDEGNVGLFGHVGESNDGNGVEIKDLYLTGVNVPGGRGTGSLIGRVTGDQNTLIFQCSSNGGNVVGSAAVGGLIGSHNSFETNPSNRNYNPTLRESWATTTVAWSRKDASALKFGG